MTLERAEAVYDRLTSSIPMHASPLEHIAQGDRYGHSGWIWRKEHGNFIGFRQLRHQIDIDGITS